MSDVAVRPAGVGRPAAELPQVLIVDDDPSIREVCADFFSGEGYAVALAGNGREALDHLARDRPAVVLMDIMMPVMDGLAACQAIKATPATEQIPVVIMSAAANIRNAGPQVSHLAEAVVPKPFDFDHLLDTVQGLISPAARRAPDREEPLTEA